MTVSEELTIGSAKQKGNSELQDFSPSPALDVSCLLCHLLSCDKTYLLMHHKDSLSPEQADWFCDAIEKRKSGLPVAYITNHKEFYGYDFYVTPDVLIPKPDTEILVENAVASITEATETFGKNKVLNICDMCSGSGCIGISVYLALLESGFPKEFFPNFTFVDISPAALQITKHNANHLIPKPVSNLRFVQSNLFENVTQRFDFILTNPPYIPASMVDELLTDGRSEPRLALDGDNNPACITKQNGTLTQQKSSDGLGLIRNELPQMFKCMDPCGQFFMETGEYNAEETALLAEKCGFKNVSILRDLEGQLRVVTGQR
ncbi:MAG: peptide chain release factor N(5)-glutamine methyltransferase [Treponema sp.]|nr:peptide chain release factor N(5)-glutamine methyltransferase [Treponema sp.]